MPSLANILLDLKTGTRRAGAAIIAVAVSSFIGIVASNTAFASVPQPWQMDLQPPAGSIAEMATDLHNLLLAVITAITVFVLGLLLYVGVKSRAAANPVPSRT